MYASVGDTVRLKQTGQTAIVIGVPDPHQNGGMIYDLRVEGQRRHCHPQQADVIQRRAR